MKNNLNRITVGGLLAAALIALPLGASGQVLPFGGGTYSQSFDGLPNQQNVSASPTTATDNGPFRLDDFSWASAVPPWTVSGMAGWQMFENGGSSGAAFSINDGTSTTSFVFSYGALNSTDRALGVLAGAARRMTFGLVLQNTTGVTIPDATISFRGEQWRLGRSGAANPADTLFFEYRVGSGADITTTGGAFTTFSALNFVTPTTVGTVGALNGDNIANQSTLNSTVTGLNWQNGDYLVLRWRDVDDTGSDHGMAIDDFSITTIPEPTTLSLTLLLGAALFGKRLRSARR